MWVRAREIGDCFLLLVSFESFVRPLRRFIPLDWDVVFVRRGTFVVYDRQG